MERSILKSILLCMGSVMAVSMVFAADQSAYDQHIDVLHGVSSSVVTELPQRNTIFCPIGPTQILQNASLIISTPEIVDEIKNYLKQTVDIQSLSAFTQALKQNANKDTLFAVGQYLIASNSYTVNEKYTPYMASLGVDVQRIDLNKPVESAAHVNGIVERDTCQMIKNLVSPADFSGDPVALVLLSTLYVETKWPYPFEERYEFFKGLDGKAIGLRKGFGEKGDYLKGYVANNTVQVMFAAKDDIVLFAHMKKGQLELVTKTMLDTFETTAVQNSYDFYMPSFEIENELDLSGILKESLPAFLGGKTFTLDLLKDLRGDSAVVRVGVFRQKNKLQVNRVGLKGASATALMMMAESYCVHPKNLPQLHFDQPFSYAVLKKIEGSYALLFTGYVVDPVAPKE